VAQGILWAGCWMSFLSPYQQRQSAENCELITTERIPQQTQNYCPSWVIYQQAEKWRERL